jgi:hypothetical protein
MRHRPAAQRGQGVKELAALPDLRKVTRSQTKVTDAGVAALRKERPDLRVVKQ